MKKVFEIRAIGILGLSLMAVSLAGCNSDSEPAPPGSVMSISPTEKEWEVVPNNVTDEDGNVFCVVDPEYYQDELVVITLKDSEGRAVGSADLTVSLNLSGNTYSGRTLVELYDDRNGDYIPDEEELVSGPGDSVLMTRTGKYDGAKTLIVRMTLSCPYRAELVATSSGYTATTSFEVIERND